MRGKTLNSLLNPLSRTHVFSVRTDPLLEGLSKPYPSNSICVGSITPISNKPLLAVVLLGLMAGGFIVRDGNGADSLLNVLRLLHQDYTSRLPGVGATILRA